jgi:Flp pilus assembly pilin Flp
VVIRRAPDPERGASAAEYALLVSVVALVIAIALAAFGQVLLDLYVAPL